MLKLLAIAYPVTFKAQFELNSFSADIRTQAISLAEKAFQSADNK